MALEALNSNKGLVVQAHVELQALNRPPQMSPNIVKREVLRGEKRVRGGREKDGGESEWRAQAETKKPPRPPPPLHTHTHTLTLRVLNTLKGLLISACSLRMDRKIVLTSTMLSRPAQALAPCPGIVSPSPM